MTPINYVPLYVDPKTFPNGDIYYQLKGKAQPFLEWLKQNTNKGKDGTEYINFDMKKGQKGDWYLSKWNGSKGTAINNDEIKKELEDLPF